MRKWIALVLGAVITTTVEGALLHVDGPDGPARCVWWNSAIEPIAAASVVVPGSVAVPKEAQGVLTRVVCTTDHHA